MTRQRSRKKAPQTANPVRIDDLERLQIVSDCQISPDGQRILFCKQHVGDRHDAVTNLWLRSVDGDECLQLTASGKDGHGRWSPDGGRIAFVSSREEKYRQIWLINPHGGEAQVLTKFPEGKISSFRWSPDGRAIAVQFRETEPEWTSEAKKEREESGASTPPRVIDDLYYRLDGDGYFNQQRFALYVVDVDSGQHRMLFDADTTGWFDYDWSPDSSELIVSANTAPDALLKPWKSELYRVNAANGRTRRLSNLPADVKATVRWSPDGDWIAYAAGDGRTIWGSRNTRLFVCRPDGRDRRELTAGTDYCLESLTLSDSSEVDFLPNILWSADSSRVFFALGWHGCRHIASAPTDGGRLVVHTSGRRCIEFGNASDDGHRIAVVAGSQTELAEAGVATFSRSSPTSKAWVNTLTEFNTATIRDRDVSHPEPHWVGSPSGNKVHTWVMKPPGFDPEISYPAVLQVHGGPHAQYGEAFFHEFQVLASAGYVVVFSNPRGSKGYGEDHCDCIRGDWGHRDWEDVQSVTRFMQEQPWIDNARIGIMGGSYGGFMTNWAIGHSNDYAAAITDRCVANLVTMAGTSDLPLVPGGYWKGNSWDDIQELWRQSPLSHFGNVTTPTLVIHSEGDLRCNVEQAEQVFAALKLRGVPTRFVRYPFSTSHGMSRGGPPDLRQHRLEQILSWLDEHL